MSHEGGSEQSQRTVAELLAKYGAETGERAPRRRRRRADDLGDTGAQAIIERVMSESGEMPVIRDDQPPPERTSHRHRTDFQRPVDPPPQQPPPRRAQPPAPPQPQPSQQLPKPPPPQPRRRPAPQPSQQLPAPPAPGGQSSARLPAIAQSSDPTRPVRSNRPLPQRSPHASQQLPVPPPVPGGNRERSIVQPSLRSRLDGQTDSAPSPPPPGPPPALAGEPTTEEMPRVPNRIQVDGTMTGRRPLPGGPDARLAPAPYPPVRDPYAPEEDYGSGYPDRDEDTGFERDGYDLDDDDLDDDDLDDDDLDDDLDDRDDLDLDDEDLDEDDLDENAERSPAKEWLALAGTLAVGVIGGAAVWMGFQWLWGALPAAALALALAVIAGFVLIVRKIRKAEDLQTTVYTVLVGLMITVSPAAVLLLKR